MITPHFPAWIHRVVALWRTFIWKLWCFRLLHDVPAAARSPRRADFYFIYEGPMG